MRIAVIGYSGAGKSTMARELGKLYSCPVLHLDRVQFEARWKERDRESALKIVEEFMQNPDWVIDGNYSGFYQERRLKEADMIVFLNFPRMLCFWQAVKRRIEYNNKVREDMADGCNEKLDLEFARWLLFDGRTRKRVKHYESIAAVYPQKIYVLRNREQAEEFMLARSGKE